MARAIRTYHVTPADELRELLADSEKRIANLRGSGAEAAELLLDLDRIDELWPELEARGMDLRPEAGRWETIQAQLRRSGPQLLREVWTVGGLDQLRSRKHPGESEVSWWWRLDDLVRQDTTARIRRTALVVSSVVIIAVAAWFAFRFLFPVDPQVQAALSAQSAGEQKIMNGGDFEGALVDFKAAAQAQPDDPEGWIRVAATYEMLGDMEAAQENFDKARALSPNEHSFFIARAGIYLAFLMLDQAFADVQAVLATDTDNPVAYYYLGSIYEGQGKIEDAIDALQKASEYASESNQSELVALARYRMAMLMQTAGMGGLRGEMPTPTATPGS